ncbi:hypothetical protein ACFLV2_01765 [Chloroflexota bacterium]
MLYKIESSISEKQLQADLETYCQYALSLDGDAKIISARDVITEHI